ncbi:MAG: hypothetical protein A2Y38_08410, partial [Spirochaetes bacterium GWB1_59_5]
MRYKKWLILATLAFAGLTMVAAQAGQSLVLEFVEGDNLDVVYPDSTSFSYKSGSIMEGDSIPVGATVKTGAGTSVELKLKPNGTVIKLAKMTTFRVEGLATPQKEQNGFTLVAGKIRTVAAVGSQYSVYTTSTVAGVRGTDFTMAFQEGAEAMLLVTKGKVEFGGRGEGDAIANAILVGAGQFADFFKGLAAAPFSPEQLAAAYDDVVIPIERMPEQAAEEAAAPAEATSPSVAAATDLTPATEPSSAEEAETAEAVSKTESAVMDWLRDVLGMEIGSITINGETWAKAVIQPTFTIGKLRTGLYLPVIYSSNLFDPSTWYRPSGNDEWSFGTDIGWNADNWLPALGDAAKDLALKIKFIEYGQPLEDKFFIKVGNLDSFTIGHGLLMRNYANDSDFPSIRRIGLNIGLDQGGWGFEALTNDLTDNQILGGRLYVRPIPDFKLAIGLSGVVDLYPAADLDEATADSYGDPMFIGGALDLDLPIVQSGLLGIRLFADGAAMVPYVRNDFTYDGNAGASGFGFDMVYANGDIKNWGAAAGLIGNVLFIDWRLEYRYFTGAFTPSFFDSSYERRRAGLVEEWAGYLSGANAIDDSPTVMGIYGEGGASILKDKLAFSLGYFWPWADVPIDQQLSASDDYFKASLVILKGLIPVVDLQGTITYERKGLAKAIANNQLDTLFDENTTFSGELAFPVPGAPNLDLAF